MNRPADLPPVRRHPRLHAGAVILVLALAPLAVKSVTNISDGLSAGSAPLTNAVHSNSAAAGINNTVTGMHAFTAGDGNSVAGYEGNFAAGKGNYLNGWSNGAIGSGNSIQSDGNGGYQSFAWGVGNQIVAGARNATAGGHYNIVNGNYGHAIGTALVNNSYGSVVLGWYNAPFGQEGAASYNAWRDQDPILVIGNGEDGVRSNALVVTKGGAVHIPAGPLTVGGYPVLTTGAGITVGGGSISNGGFLAAGPNLAGGMASAALGYDTGATGYASLATGRGTMAPGYGTATFGSGTTAWSFTSLAGGWGAEAGVSGGETLSDGDHPGAFSLSFGKETKARGTASVSLGYQSAALAHSSLASGYKSEAYGGGSVAMGWDSKAWKRGQTVLGRRNAFPAAPSPLPVADQTNTAFSDEDEVLVVGGGNDTVRKNALTVKANGNVKTPGKVEAAGRVEAAGAIFTQPVILTAGAVAGDIPMFNAGN